MRQSGLAVQGVCAITSRKVGEPPMATGKAFTDDD
jgi:hypothetical protein